MKALLLLLLGVIIFTVSGALYLRHDLGGTALGAVCFVGLLTGSALALYGLIANHHDHTRRR